MSEVLSRKSEGGEVRAKEALSLFDDLHQESRTDPATVLHLRASACQEAVFALFHNAQFDQSGKQSFSRGSELDCGDRHLKILPVPDSDVACFLDFRV